jgi:homoaconitase/3-isopropylmalate dehydratase large subunit
MQECMTLANMTAKIGAQTGLIAPDELTRAYLRSAGVQEVEINGWRRPRTSISARPTPWLRRRCAG